MLGEILIFLFGIGLGVLWRPLSGLLQEGSSHPVVRFDRQYGCSKTVQHLCACVKPHGHESGVTDEVRWHTCEHGSIRVVDQAGHDLN